MQKSVDACREGGPTYVVIGAAINVPLCAFTITSRYNKATHHFPTQWYFLHHDRDEDHVVSLVRPRTGHVLASNVNGKEMLASLAWRKLTKTQTTANIKSYRWPRKPRVTGAVSICVPHCAAWFPDGVLCDSETARPLVPGWLLSQYGDRAADAWFMIRKIHKL